MKDTLRKLLNVATENAAMAGAEITDEAGPTFHSRNGAVQMTTGAVAAAIAVTDSAASDDPDLLRIAQQVVAELAELGLRRARAARKKEADAAYQEVLQGGDERSTLDAQPH